MQAEMTEVLHSMDFCALFVTASPTHLWVHTAPSNHLSPAGSEEHQLLLTFHTTAADTALSCFCFTSIHSFLDCQHAHKPLPESLLNSSI